MKVELLKPLKNPNKKYEVCISTSLFRMQSAYKPFDKYLTMLEKSIKSVNYNACFRLYVDKSVMLEDSYKKFISKNIPNLEIYRYEDKRFLLEDGIHHDGTFGSIARFLAFFDRSIKADYIWVADADLFEREFDYHYIAQMKKARTTVAYVSRGCYERNWIPNSVDYPIINYKVIVKKGIYLSKAKFDNFLTEVSKDVYRDIFLEIEKRVTDPNAKRKMFGIKQFIYGFDELYSNGPLFKELSKHRRLIFDDLSLDYLRYIEGIPFDKEKGDKVNKDLFYKSYDLNLRKEGLQFYENIVKEIEEKNLMNLLDNHPRLQMCIEGFNKYKTDLKSKEPGLYTYVVVDPKTYRKTLETKKATLVKQKRFKIRRSFARKALK
jgi:hypothetical protein